MGHNIKLPGTPPGPSGVEQHLQETAERWSRDLFEFAQAEIAETYMTTPREQMRNGTRQPKPRPQGRPKIRGSRRYATRTGRT